jgi:hypothetical protein
MSEVRGGSKVQGSTFNVLRPLIERITGILTLNLER